MAKCVDDIRGKKWMKDNNKIFHMATHGFVLKNKVIVFLIVFSFFIYCLDLHFLN